MKSLAPKINRSLPVSFLCAQLMVFVLVLTCSPWVADAQDSSSGYTPAAAQDQFVLPAAAPVATTAATSTAPASLVSSDRTDALWSVAKTGGATLFVVTLILLVTILLKRQMPHRFGAL